MEYIHFPIEIVVIRPIAKADCRSLTSPFQKPVNGQLFLAYMREGGLMFVAQPFVSSAMIVLCVPALDFHGIPQVPKQSIYLRLWH